MKQIHKGKGDNIAGDKITNFKFEFVNWKVIIAFIVILVVILVIINISRPDQDIPDSGNRLFDRNVLIEEIEYFDNIDSLTAEKIGDNPIGLLLKNNELRIGSLVGTNDDKFNRDSIGFIDYSKKDEFIRLLNNPTSNNEKLRSLMESFARKDISKYEIPENKIGSISLKNGAQIPNFFTVQVTNQGKPGHINIKYQIYGNPKWFEIGDLRVIKGNIYLPLKLAYATYSKKDEKIVKKVLSELNDNGVLTWFDQKELMPGDLWRDKILKTLQTSDFVLIFLSKNSVRERGFFQKEIRIALEEINYRPEGEKYIIPVFIDNVKPPTNLAEFQGVNLWEEGAIEKLSNALHYPDYVYLKKKFD